MPPTDTLTDKQAEVMALVAQGLTSKEIAKILEVSPYTVDQRADSARKKLGGETRAAAARRYAAAHSISERLVYEPIPLPSHSETDAHLSPPRDVLQFQDAVFDDRAAWDRGQPWRWPNLAPRDLGIAGRLLAIVVFAVFILITGGELLRFAHSLGMMFSA